MFICSHKRRKNTYKIQLHCHTTESDGKLSPADAMFEYRRLGFDAVAITDHDSLTIAPTPDPGGHGLLFITSIEESFGIPSHPERTAHMTAVGTSFYYPDPPDGAKPSSQSVINHHPTAFLSIAHPTYAANNPWATVPDEDIVALQGYHAIEICSSYCRHNGQEGTPEEKWEIALNAGKRIWGTGVDDTHDYSRTPPVQGGAYCVVSADERTWPAILDALKAGNFYPTQGPELMFCADGARLDIATTSPSTIVWRGPSGVLSAVHRSCQSVIEPPCSLPWVRAIVIRESDGKQAWSQPFFNVEYRDVSFGLIDNQGS